jgi:hypothetical protein
MLLQRIGASTRATFGVLILDGIPFALTLERPWLNNQTGISCIPPGVYVCKRVQSPKFGNTFEVTNVPGRTHILFHKGNITDDTHGCIIVGEEFAVQNGQPSVASSVRGFSEFLDKYKSVNEFVLTVR